ncbi:MAG: hypothetical protein ACRDF0_11825 [Candidatus Limnocylindria bacterium]
MDISLTPRGGVHIEGFPDAVKVIALAPASSRETCDLALHIQDLDFAMNCLAAINGQTEWLLREALWRSAIVHFFKCFGDSVRSRLLPEKVYSGDPEGLEVFRYFRDLRNKHFVHDENLYAHCVGGAILNRQSMDHKIAKVVSLALRGETLDQEHWSNLRLLVERARSWVTTQYELVCSRVAEELEAETYEVLDGREGIVPRIPGLDRARFLGQERVLIMPHARR